MAKIIGFDAFYNARKATIKQLQIQQEVENLEKKLGLEDDPLLVLSDEMAMTIGNSLLDARNEINRALEVLGIDESEEIFDE